MTSSSQVAPHSQQPNPTQPALGDLVRDIERLETIVDGWEETQQHTVQALRQAIDRLHTEAFSRLIREIKSHPAAQPGLRQAVSDEVVYAVLRHFQLIKPSLHERIEDALASVRPSLQTHGGDVELVAVRPPDTVDIQLLGACHGCPSSSLTLTEGVEKAIKDSCPEITSIHTVKGAATLTGEHGVPLHFVSPFAKTAEEGWQSVTNVEHIPENGVTVNEVSGHSLLFSRQGHQVTCFENSCAHMGMPLDMGEVNDGIITCPYHGFQYSLTSGECLTASEVQLLPHAVRVTGTTVEIKFSE
ncbi:NifU family protein [Candidatus Nitrospira salsa]